MAYQFDFDSRLIYITSPQTEVVIQDLIDEIRANEASQTGITYDKIANASGKESLGGQVNVGITVQLLDWQIKFWEGNYIASITGGNLTGGVSGDPVAYSAGVQVLLIQSAASTVVQVSTGSGLSGEEHDKLMGLPQSSTITNDVWSEEDRGTKLDFVHKMEGGKWTIVNDQMIFFESDNLTEIARFNLFDSSGNPTTINAFSRVRV